MWTYWETGGNRSYSLIPPVSYSIPSTVNFCIDNPNNMIQQDWYNTCIKHLYYVTIIQSVPEKMQHLIKWHLYLCYRIISNVLTTGSCSPFIHTHSGWLLCRTIAYLSNSDCLVRQPQNQNYTGYAYKFIYMHAA